jgi:hypothetical protein
MQQSIEVTIDEQGKVRLLEPIQVSEPRRAVVTILTDERDFSETALLRTCLKSAIFKARTAQPTEL